MDTNKAGIVPTSGENGLTINLHPLAILNISEHHMRDTLHQQVASKAVGVLLGTQDGRQVSIVNTFELKLSKEDVDMDTSSSTGGGGGGGGGSRWTYDRAFMDKRRAQYQEVFPTLEVLGWYSIGTQPSEADVALHQQFFNVLENPLFVLLTPPEPNQSSTSSPDLPLKIYESALGTGEVVVQETDESTMTGATTSSTPTVNPSSKFVELPYNVQTGEAERIAVDGAAKAVPGSALGGGGRGGETVNDGLVAHLNSQRNAITMLYDRMMVLLDYVNQVEMGTAQVDHQVLRQISSVVSTLPVMSDVGFQKAFSAEYADTQLTTYMANLTKQMAVLNDLTDKFAMIYESRNVEMMPGGGGMGMGMGDGMGGRRHGPTPGGAAAYRGGAGSSSGRGRGRAKKQVPT